MTTRKKVLDSVIEANNLNVEYKPSNYLTCAGTSSINMIDVVAFVSAVGLKMHRDICLQTQTNSLLVYSLHVLDNADQTEELYDLKPTFRAPADDAIFALMWYSSLNIKYNKCSQVCYVHDPVPLELS